MKSVIMIDGDKWYIVGENDCEIIGTVSRLTSVYVDYNYLSVACNIVSILRPSPNDKIRGIKLIRFHFGINYMSLKEAKNAYEMAYLIYNKLAAGKQSFYNWMLKMGMLDLPAATV